MGVGNFPGAPPPTPSPIRKGEGKRTAVSRRLRAGSPFLVFLEDRIRGENTQALTPVRYCVR